MLGRVRSEASIERSACARLAEAGVMNVKMYKPGWPDRMYLCGGRVCFVEFKRPCGRTTPLQRRIHADLAKLGFDVTVQDDAKAATDWVLSKLQREFYG